MATIDERLMFNGQYSMVHIPSLILMFGVWEVTNGFSLLLMFPAVTVDGWCFMFDSWYLIDTFMICGSYFKLLLMQPKEWYQEMSSTKKYI